MKKTRLAAIDIGSNSARLLIVDAFDYNGETIFKKDSLFRIPLKLGEDTFSAGYISEKKMRKLTTLIHSFKGLMDVYDVEHWKACGTSALREASNSADILDYVQTNTGVSIDVIDPKEESRYILLNNIEANMQDDRLYIFTDVGGGSTELIFYNEGKEIASDSFKIGTIRALDSSEVESEWERMKIFIKELCADYPKVSLVGSGGNINKLDSLLRRCGRVKREELVSFANKFRKMTYEERLINLNLNMNRADVILPAIEIYLRIMKMAHAVVIETPIIGVTDGIIKDLYLKQINK